MPKIIIREIDKTTAGAEEYSNFTVVVPGFANDSAAKHNNLAEIALADNIYEFTTQKDFVDYIGKVAKDTGSDLKNDGNQMAYELLGLGYTVIYMVITNVADMEEEDFWSPLKDKAVFDFRYITTGGYCNAKAYEIICKLAKHNKNETLEGETTTGRGDCTALIDVDESGITGGMTDEVIDAIKAEVANYTEADKYSAIMVPHVIYDGIEQDTYENSTFPASFHYLACAAYARNELKYNEWYAPAGYTRGICKYKVIGTTLNLGDIAANALQPRTAVGSGEDIFNKSVNIIKKVRNNYYFWGNRTAHELDSEGLVASHFLNIRQLCSSIKKDVYKACEKFTFDPNSDVLWGNFCNAIKPTLEKMKADQGITAYKIIKLVSKKKAVLAAKIRIVPIEAVEDFDISVYLEDSIAGVSVSADEE